jgi:hypothetical protein
MPEIDNLSLSIAKKEGNRCMNHEEIEAESVFLFDWCKAGCPK